MELITFGMSSYDQDRVAELCKLRFRNHREFVTAEAWICYEYGLWSKEESIVNCEKYYKQKLSPIIRSYIEQDTLHEFKGTMFIPGNINKPTRQLTLYTLPEIPPSSFTHHEYRNYDITYLYTDICTWIESYRDSYGYPPFMLPIPELDIYRFIINESIASKVIDTTISSGAEGGRVYHNINLDIHDSKIKISNDQVDSIFSILGMEARNSSDLNNLFSKRWSVSFNDDYRLRVEATPNHYGVMITLRLLPNGDFDYTLEAINLDPKTIAFIRRYNQNLKVRGARIMAGPTGSGKNTTQFSDLKEVLAVNKIKAISVEQPVELILKGMEQLNADTEELYKNYSESLIRHNPGIVYISEITDKTAVQFMKVANTGKVVYSTIHTNRASTIISRLQDLTGLSIDRIMQDIVVCMYQTLEKDPIKGMRPYNTCIYFSEKLKRECLGKSLGEVMAILMREEDRWHSITAEDILNGVLD